MLDANSEYCPVCVDVGTILSRHCLHIVIWYTVPGMARILISRFLTFDLKMKMSDISILVRFTKFAFSYITLKLTSHNAALFKRIVIRGKQVSFSFFLPF